MPFIKTVSLSENAQKLRKNMTPEELHLWRDCLQKLPVRVNRQKQIGEYIVDFYCAKAKLVIEIDGSRHFTKEGKAEDSKRDAFLNSLGMTVMRFSNSEVTNDFKEVNMTIVNYIEAMLVLRECKG